MRARGVAIEFKRFEGCDLKIGVDDTGIRICEHSVDAIVPLSHHPQGQVPGPAVHQERALLVVLLLLEIAREVRDLRFLHDPAKRVDGVGLDHHQRKFLVLRAHAVEPLTLQDGVGGSAGEFVIARDSISMQNVTYTTCPIGNEDWLLKAGSLEIEEDKSRGVARGVQIRFRDVPVMYVPYLSFPVNDERKSGLLFPVIGTSSRSGGELAVPIYWNIAPNYDAIFTPHYMRKRGFQQNMEFRYLQPRSEGTLDVEFLADDKLTNTNRSYGLWEHKTNWSNRWQALAHIEGVSDSNYFEDFGRGVDITSRTYVERNLQLNYANII